MKKFSDSVKDSNRNMKSTGMGGKAKLKSS